MTYSGIQMFMDKLNHLIHNSNEIPLFNYPEIISERPQFQLLYKELGSIIQTLFIQQHQNLDQFIDLKQRFIHAAEEAEYIVDLFLSSVHIRNNGHFPTSEEINPSLNLDDVRRSFKSVEVELMSMRIDSIKVDSSPRPATTGIPRNSLGSKKPMDEIFVGLDDDVDLIRDKLVEDEKKLDVVSIGGMGGIGKTTLATKVFNDDDVDLIRDKLVEPQKRLDVVSIVGTAGIGKTTLATKVFNDGFVKYHFAVRVWVTFSQTYDERAVMIQMLESMGVEPDLEKATDSSLRVMVYRHLIGKRYLIVFDDIWDIKAWDNLKILFPHDGNGSRILLTSRLTEVAKHASPHGLIHHLDYLNETNSWKLLCGKVFHGSECPEWLITPGMKIVENCKGLPLALVVIAGVLATDVWSKKWWEEIADRTGSCLGDQNGYLETLNLSYDHLPLYLRVCFLYLGGFPEDYEIEVQRLIWLWVAEGFIEEDGDRSLEDIAEGYLMDLIDRNLVIVVDKRNSNGAVIACKVHVLVRELCLIKAKEEQLILITERQILSSDGSDVITPPYKPIHMFIKDDNILSFPYPPSQNIRSIMWFRNNFISLSDDIAKYLCSFELLRVLDLPKCELKDFPKAMEWLVHLRYLAIWSSTKKFPSSICNLWGLQTLIYITEQSSRVVLPSNISDLVNLRHLWSYHPYTKKGIKRNFFLPSIKKPMNLQTISGAVLGDEVDSFQKYFPCIKELTCITYSQKHYEFKSLPCLQKLKLTVHDGPKGEPKNHITFPETLKSLTLAGCALQWTDMSIIQLLPNLLVLKLKYLAFEGSCWKTERQEFRQLKFLRIDGLDIKRWEADSTSFPCLKQLEIFYCHYLEEIPLEIWDIPTLELIKIKRCNDSVDESVRRIQEELHELGDLKIVRR